MKNIILHILCEGQTEERFVKKILAPNLQAYCIYPKPVLLMTSRKKNARGGMISFAKVQGDMSIMLKQCHDSGSDRHLYTTMFDYYALPNDFPGVVESTKYSEVRDRIEYIEKRIGEIFNNNRLIPYIQLHEFESLLFSDIMKLSLDYPESIQQIEELKNETDCFEDPEMINNRPETAPSKRIIKAVRDRYEYNKVQSGTNITSAIGFEKMREKCRHFNDWINRIIYLSESL